MRAGRREEESAADGRGNSSGRRTKRLELALAAVTEEERSLSFDTRTAE
jgi:hypothetical protein